jgi:hypothetical protein
MHIDLHLRVPARLTAVGTKLTVMDVRSLVRYRVISGPESPGPGASSFTVAPPLGRPPGLPLTPFSNGRPRRSDHAAGSLSALEISASVAFSASLTATPPCREIHLPWTLRQRAG